MKETKQIFLRLIRTLSKKTRSIWTLLRKTNEDGFTLIETVLTVFLFSVLAITVAGSVIIGQRVVTRVITTSHADLKSVQLDSYVRGLLARVKFPFWLASYKYEYKADSLEIPYLDGKPDKYLVIKSEDEGFYIGYRDETKDVKEDTKDTKVKVTKEAEETTEELIFFGPYFQSKLEVDDDDELIQAVHIFITKAQGSQEQEINAVLSTNAFWYTGL